MKGFSVKKLGYVKRSDVMNGRRLPEEAKVNKTAWRGKRGLAELLVPVGPVVNILVGHLNVAAPWQKTKTRQHWLPRPTTNEPPASSQACEGLLALIQVHQVIKMASTKTDYKKRACSSQVMIRVWMMKRFLCSKSLKEIQDRKIIQKYWKKGKKNKLLFLFF